MPEVRTRVMLALEHLMGAAARDGDTQLLGVCCEAWERNGWAYWPLDDIVRSAGWQGHGLVEHLWTPEEAAEMVRASRYRRNRAKLRHQADALLAAIPHIPMTESDWSRAKFAHLHKEAPCGE